MHLSSKELKTTEINLKNFKKLWNINIVAFELAILQLHIKIIILIAIIYLFFHLLPALEKFSADFLNSDLNVQWTLIWLPLSDT